MAVQRDKVIFILNINRFLNTVLIIHGLLETKIFYLVVESNRPGNGVYKDCHLGISVI